MPFGMAPHALFNQGIHDRSLFRRWSHPSPKCDGSKYSFSVLSLNILAPSLIQREQFISLKQLWALEWNFRWNLIWQEIVSQNCDIIALQEVEEGIYHSILGPALASIGYRGVYRKRTSPVMSDGEALFVREDSFEVVRMGHIDYERTDHPTLSDSLNRPNVAVWADLISLKAEGRPRLIAASTHLLFNPKRGDVKLAQAHTLLTELKNVGLSENESGKLPPIIICGDFNITPGSGVYNYFCEGTPHPSPEAVAGLDRRNISGQMDQMREIKYRSGVLNYNRLGHRGVGSAIILPNLHPAKAAANEWHALGAGFDKIQNPLGSLRSAYAEKYRAKEKKEESSSPPPGEKSSEGPAKGVIDVATHARLFPHDPLEPAYTIFNIDGFQGCVDYILHTDDLETQCVLEMPYIKSFIHRGLPNQSWASDRKFRLFSVFFIYLFWCADALFSFASRFFARFPNAVQMKSTHAEGKCCWLLNQEAFRQQTELLRLQ